MNGTTRDTGTFAAVVAMAAAAWRFVKNKRRWPHAKIVDPECERKVAQLEARAVAQAGEMISLQIDKAKLEMKVHYMQKAIDDSQRDRDELRASMAILRAQYEELRQEMRHG